MPTGRFNGCGLERCVRLRIAFLRFATRLSTAFGSVAAGRHGRSC